MPALYIAQWFDLVTFFIICNIIDYYYIILLLILMQSFRTFLWCTFGICMKKCIRVHHIIICFSRLDFDWRFKLVIMRGYWFILLTAELLYQEVCWTRHQISSTNIVLETFYLITSSFLISVIFCYDVELFHSKFSFLCHTLSK